MDTVVILKLCLRLRLHVVHLLWHLYNHAVEVLCGEHLAAQPGVGLQARRQVQHVLLRLADLGQLFKGRRVNVEVARGASRLPAASA